MRTLLRVPFVFVLTWFVIAKPSLKDQCLISSSPNSMPLLYCIEILYFLYSFQNLPAAVMLPSVSSLFFAINV